MKHSLLYIFILAMMAGLLSCSKELEQDGGLVSDMPLVFSPTADWPQMGNGNLSGSGTRSGNGTWNGTGTGAVTKALVESAEDLKQYGISLFATATKGEDIYPVFNNDNLKFTGGAWNYDITKYWIPGAVYRFAAFAPYATTGEKTSNTISNGTVDVTGTDSEPSIRIRDYITGRPKNKAFDARCEDLLFASHIRDNTTGSDYSSVPLHFNHLLSCLSFKIRNATSTDIETVESISLTGLHYEAEINVSNITATVSHTAKTVGESDGFFAGNNLTGSAKNPFLPKGMSEEQFKDLFDCTDLTVLPQTIYGKEIKIKFTVRYSNSSSTDYSGNLGTIEGITRWQPGKKYRYNITISSQEIIFQVAEVPWIKHEVEL